MTFDNIAPCTDEAISAIMENLELVSLPAEFVPDEEELERLFMLREKEPQS